MNKKEIKILIFFGASSNLFQTKILPALYRIILDDIEINKYNKFFIIGTTNSNKISKKDIIYNAKNYYIKNNKLNNKIIDDNFLSKIEEKFQYIKIDFKNSKDWINFKKLLTDIIDKLNKEFEIKEKLVYLSVYSIFYKTIIQNLNKLKLIDTKYLKDAKFVFEKPFGWDYKSASNISRYINKYINNKNIFYVDHYISKDIVNTIIKVINSNIFKNIWSSKYIESIQILMEEKDDIKDRIRSYESYGALKDVIQNHLLQLLAIISINNDKNDISKLKYNILKKVEPISGYLGQFKGYNDIIKNSNTETFAYIEFKINTKRWENTKFSIKTGKALEKEKKEIIIKFKSIDDSQNNYFIIRLAYKSSYNLIINNLDKQINLSFCYDCFYDIHTSYYKIINDILNNKKEHMVTIKEIKAQWKIIEKIIVMNLPIYYYDKWSKGPEIDHIGLSINIE